MVLHSCFTIYTILVWATLWDEIHSHSLNPSGEYLLFLLLLHCILHHYLPYLHCLLLCVVFWHCGLDFQEAPEYGTEPFDFIFLQNTTWVHFSLVVVCNILGSMPDQNHDAHCSLGDGGWQWVGWSALGPPQLACRGVTYTAYNMCIYIHMLLIAHVIV